MRQPIRLIVNADDYGYYPCVSRGIIEAAAQGVVSATGILANGPKLKEQIKWLGERENLDLGVHLNLTFRAPMTSAMAAKLKSWGGSFPGVFAMASRIVSGGIGLELVRAEWRAQIEAVLSHGVTLMFLNSHEHIHMLPGVFPLAVELAEEYRIPHLRLTQAEWLPPFGISTGFRSLLMQAMESVDRRYARAGTPLFIGLSRSGRLDPSYLEKRFATLQAGAVYELMCHPGAFDPAENIEPRILAYHRWEDELDLLTGPNVMDLYDRFGIRIVNYRDLTESP